MLADGEQKLLFKVVKPLRVKRVRVIRTSGTNLPVRSRRKASGDTASGFIDKLHDIAHEKQAVKSATRCLLHITGCTMTTARSSSIRKITNQNFNLLQWKDGSSADAGSSIAAGSPVQPPGRAQCTAVAAGRRKLAPDLFFRSSFDLVP